MSLLLRMYPGDAWALLVVNVLVQVTVVILAAWLLARLGSRWNAAWRHTIYLVALVCVLASPVLSSVMQATGIALMTLRPPAPAALPRETASVPTVQIPESAIAQATDAPQIATTRVPQESQSLGRGVVPENRPYCSSYDLLRAASGAAWMIWLLGIAFLLARWCQGLRLIGALRRAAQPLDPNAMPELLHAVRQNLGADRLPPLATSADLDRPIMVGLMHPLVILPEDVLRTLREPELADILVHECAHAVCRHHVVGFLQRLAGILFWPHPLVHLLNRELARAREEVCDNYVLRCGNAPRYARTLLELSQSLGVISPKPAALGLFHCRWKLEDRVTDLLDRRRRIMARVNRFAVAALTAAFLLPAILIGGIRVVQAEPAAASAVRSEEPAVRAAQLGTTGRFITKVGRYNLYDGRLVIKVWEENGKIRWSATRPARVTSGRTDSPESMTPGGTMSDGTPWFLLASSAETIWNYDGDRKMNLAKFGKPANLWKEVDLVPGWPLLFQPDAIVPEEVLQRLPRELRSLTPESAPVAVTQDVNKHATSAGTLALQTTSEFPYVVEFEQGVTRFADGDKITISEVRGTANTFTPGNIYWIKGTYTLASHDRATLAAYTTARDAADARSRSFQPQTINVTKGTGTFTLFLPMSCRGWPHVSYYPADGGEGFGGNYFGTGDSVLKRWWGSEETSASQPPDYLKGSGHTTFTVGHIDKAAWEVLQKQEPYKHQNLYGRWPMTDVYSKTLKNGTKPGDTVLALLSLRDLPGVPEECSDLLLLPRFEIESRLKRGQTVFKQGKVRGMNVFLVATPGFDDMRREFRRLITEGKFTLDKEAATK